MNRLVHAISLMITVDRDSIDLATQSHHGTVMACALDRILVTALVWQQLQVFRLKAVPSIVLRVWMMFDIFNVR